jgi:hypothetical protein
MSSIINDLSNICLQRARRQLYNIPFPRFTLISPYINSYTIDDLNMRRKAEILKYSNNASSTKTNNLTKKQVYSQIVSTTNIASTNNNTKCVVDTCGNFIYTPTSSCDVPGKIQYLYCDETVPLYNYGNVLQNRSYAYQMPNNDVLWYIYTTNNIYCKATSPAIVYNTDGYIQSILFPTTEENTLFSIYILNNIDKNKYTFTIQTPISIYLAGYTSISTSTIISIKNIQVNVYYNSTIVYNTTIGEEGFSPFTLNLSSNKRYSANVFIGDILFTIPDLQTKSGYIYDIKLTTTFQTIVFTNNTVSDTLDTMNLNTYMNTSERSDTTANCSISSYIKPIYSPFSISGV